MPQLGAGPKEPAPKRLPYVSTFTDWGIFHDPSRSKGVTNAQPFTRAEVALIKDTSTPQT